MKAIVILWEHDRLKTSFPDGTFWEFTWSTDPKRFEYYLDELIKHVRLQMRDDILGFYTEMRQAGYLGPVPLDVLKSSAPVSRKSEEQ